MKIFVWQATDVQIISASVLQSLVILQLLMYVCVVISVSYLVFYLLFISVFLLECQTVNMFLFLPLTYFIFLSFLILQVLWLCWSFLEARYESNKTCLQQVSKPGEQVPLVSKFILKQFSNQKYFFFKCWSS